MKTFAKITALLCVSTLFACGQSSSRVASSTAVPATYNFTLFTEEEGGGEGYHGETAVTKTAANLTVIATFASWSQASQYSSRATLDLAAKKATTSTTNTDRVGTATTTTANFDGSSSDGLQKAGYNSVVNNAIQALTPPFQNEEPDYINAEAAASVTVLKAALVK